MKTVLYPCDPLTGRGFDEAFLPEITALRFRDDVKLASVDHDMLRYDETRFRSLPDSGNVTYRGWMMTVEQYQIVHDAMLRKGLSMLTSVDQYRTAHRIDGWVDVLDDLTFRTVLLPADADEEQILEAVAGFRSNKFFIKDYVKSLKSNPELSVSTWGDLPATFNAFVEEQGEWLTGGVAVREFNELPEDRVEVRGWWRDGNWVTFTAHPDYVSAGVVPSVPAEFLTQVDEKLEQLGVGFVSVDFVETVFNGWKVIEIGDGQVTGLPDGLDDGTIQKIVL